MSKYFYLSMTETNADGEDVIFKIPDLSSSNYEDFENDLKNDENEESIILLTYIQYFFGKININEMKEKLDKSRFEYVFSSRYSWKNLINAYCCFNKQSILFGDDFCVCCTDDLRPEQCKDLKPSICE